MWLSFIINSGLIALAIMVHFELLNLLSRLIPRLSMQRRLRILLGVFGTLFAHVIEIWIFAFGFYYKIQSQTFGSLVGNFDNSLLDCVYYSFT